MKNILIDRNIRRRAITHTTEQKPRKVLWGGQEIESPGVVERVRIYPRPDEIFISEQLPYLATIGELSRQGQIVLYTSPELEWERFTQPGSKDGWCGFDLLFDVDLQEIKSPVDRTILISGNPSETIGLSKNEKMHFLKSITHPRFTQIRHAFGDAHIDDAFHLWSAEVSQLDIFLTLDGRFIRQYETKKKQIGSSVAALAPKQLCERLGAPATDIDKLAAKHPWWQ